jgi:hypothetical protein
MGGINNRRVTGHSPFSKGPVRAYKKDYGCGGNKSDCVFGRADKLSGIMPSSQSINYAPGAGCARAREDGLLEDRAQQPPTRPRSISLIIQSVASE